MRRAALVAILLLSTSCIGVNKDPNCRWPADHQARALDLAAGSDRRHLADDAQTAEDLAIRHADASRSPDWQRNVAEYHRVREECKARLFTTVSTQHAVSTEAVVAAVGDRREWLDAIVIGAFALAFLTIARIATRFMLRGALVDSRLLGGAMILAAALAAGIVAVAGGSVFIAVVESIRVGNGHMSYRVDRLPLRHRPIETFAAGAICFMSVGAVQLQRKRVN